MDQKDDLFILVHPDKSFYQISTAEYRALLLDQPALSIASLAGQRVRFAHLNVHMTGAHSGSITRAYYRLLSFQASGEVDRDAFFKPLFDDFSRLVAQKHNPPTATGNVVQARARFEINAAHWVPSEEILAGLHTIAFKRLAPKPLLSLYQSGTAA